MAICHLIIGADLIGQANEECYLPTWVYQVKRNRDFIKANKEDLYIKDFENLSDREIFEIIIKSNELDDEFDKDYLYWPQLDNVVWQNHYLTIDETIDGFSICYYVKDDKVNFIVEKVWPRIQKKENRVFNYKTVDFTLFIDTLDKTIDFLEAHYPYLTDLKKWDDINSS